MPLFRPIAILCLALAPFAAMAQEQSEKLADDPTKVVTQIGVRATNITTSVMGSIAFGPVNKLNLTYSENGEWSFGASHLFRLGIVNISGSNRELDSGIEQTLYSIGTFIPLSQLTDTGKWQLFPTLGYNYAESEVPVYSPLVNEVITVPVTSHSAYLGLFGLRPLGPKWTALAGAVGVTGTDEYSAFSLGAGLTYNLTNKDSVTGFAGYSDNTFGSREVFGVGYKHQF